VPYAWIAQHACQDGWARAFGISPTHVSRLLAGSGGAAAVIERARLGRACDLLQANPSLNLTAIARTCGFTDASHLVRRFRLSCGVTPAAWRRSLSRDPLVPPSRTG